MKKILEKSSEIIGVGKDNLKKHNKKIIKKNYENFFINKNENILELGFGWNAVFLEYLYEQGFKNLSGVEIDKVAYNKVKSKFDDKIKLYNSDIISFFNNNNIKYDIIIMRHLIEHLNKDDIENTINSIYKSLNKGGRLIIETPNVINQLGLDSYNRDYTHQTPFTPESLMHCMYKFENKRIIKVKYPLINNTSLKHFIGSIISIIISKFYNITAFIKSFSFGNKGPYTINIIGFFKK